MSTPDTSLLVLWPTDREDAARVRQTLERVLARMAPMQSPAQGAPAFAPHAGVAVVFATASDDARALEWAQHKAHAGARVVLCAAGSSRWSIGQRCHVLLLGVRCVLDCDGPEFFTQLASTLRLWTLEAEAASHAGAELRHIMDEIGLVGHGVAMRELVSLLRRAAPLSSLPVLVTGETGSGKELVARSIHRLDPRRCNGPFVAVNCAAIAPDLAEALLFGHQRGAYTGAHRDTIGLFRAADGGTLLLDEIGELGEAVQAKLLRALQERKVLPVGANAEIGVDVRVIAATHRDLSARVRDGLFREDLYWRLAVVTIDVPPLRARREDIGMLIDHLLDRFASQHDGRPRRATAALREALMLCELPGNVRQLDNLLRRAVVAAGDATEIDIAHLPEAVLRSLDAVPAVHDAPPPTSGSEPSAACAPAGESLDELFRRAHWNLAACEQQLERELLRSIYQRTRGNQTAMARLLGITPRSVYTKLRKHSLS